MLKGYRTYILGAVTVIGAVAAYLVGDTTITEAVNLSINAILLMFVRSGVTTEIAKLK
jgi:hypothetical protein